MLTKVTLKKIIFKKKRKLNLNVISVKLLSLNIIDAISLETNKTKMDPHMCVESAAIFFHSQK